MDVRFEISKSQKFKSANIVKYNLNIDFFLFNSVKSIEILIVRLYINRIFNHKKKSVFLGGKLIVLHQTFIPQ